MAVAATPETGRIVYQYCNPDGTKYCEVTRFDKPDGHKDCYTDPPGLPGPHPLYRAERLAGLPVTAKIYVVEGEKCVHALEKAGLIGVTSKGGAKSSAQTDWSPLSVFKQVCVLPDNDAPGREYAQNVIDLLADLPGQREVTICDLPGLPEKGDVYDFLQDHSVDELLAAISEHGQAANTSKLATLAGPSESVTLLREIPKSEPFPVYALGGNLMDVVYVIAESIAVPPAIAGQSILAAVALSVQAHGNLLIDGRLSPASLFCLTVAETGDRKTAVDAVALAPHRDWMLEEIEVYRAQEHEYNVMMKAYDAAMKKAVIGKKNRDAIQVAMKEVGDPPERPRIPSLLIGNLTAEGLHKQLVESLPYCGVFSDEAGTLLGGFAMQKEQRLNTLSDFSKLWDAKGQLRTRAGNGLTSTFGKRVSMHLMCQPDVAAILFGQRLAHEQGFIPRLLVTWPETLRGTRMYRRINLMENAQFQKYRATVERILKAPVPYADDKGDSLKPDNITLSPGAYELWVAFHDRIESQNAKGSPLDPIHGWASKAAEHAGRIACVLSLYDNLDTTSITPERMQSGIALAEYYLNEMYRVHAQGEQDEAILVANNLLKFMQDKAAEFDNVFPSAHLLQYGPNQIRNTVSLQETLTLLQSMDAVEPVPGHGKKWRLK